MNIYFQIYILEVSNVYIVEGFKVCRGEKMKVRIKFKNTRINFKINDKYKKQILDYANQKGMNLTDYIMYCIQKDMK